MTSTLLLPVLSEIASFVRPTVSVSTSSILDEFPSTTQCSSPTPIEASPVTTPDIPLVSGHVIPAKPLELHILVDGHHMKTRVASGIIKLNPKYALQACTSPTVPNGFSEAMKEKNGRTPWMQKCWHYTITKPGCWYIQILQ